MKDEFLDTLMEIRDRLNILESESEDESYCQGIRDADAIILDLVREYL